MKFVSWNVNGLRACMQKGFMESFQTLNADFFCLQETKLQPDQIDLTLPGYRQYWHSAEKKGYSGTAVFSRMEPLSVSYDIGDEAHIGEGRSITLEFPRFYLVTVYTPNGSAWTTARLMRASSFSGPRTVMVAGLALTLPKI